MAGSGRCHSCFWVSFLNDQPTSSVSSFYSVSGFPECKSHRKSSRLRDEKLSSLPQTVTKQSAYPEGTHAPPLTQAQSSHLSLLFSEIKLGGYEHDFSYSFSSLPGHL